MTTKWPTSISDLPNCFIIEIISRLPMKTIMACKCVSKNWYDLLSDPIFAKLHLHRSPQTTVLTFVNVRIPGGDKQAHLYDLEDPCPEKTFRQTSFPDPKFDGSVIFGSCNGLILFGARSEPEFYVCNPVVRKQIKLPTASVKIEMGFICGLYGIGYCHVSDKYKVIKITQYYIDREVEDKVEICEIGQHMSWRPIESVPQGKYWWNRGGVFINGALYWFVSQLSDYPFNVGSICCFDVGREQFHLLPPPPPLERFHTQNSVELWKTATGKWWLRCSYVRFCLWEGCFSVCYFDRNCMNMWVMREYGVKESWTKAFTVGTSSEICPLGKLSNGEIFMIMINRGDLATYNLVTQKLVEEETAREDCFVELVYKPSFISPEDL